MRLKRLNRTQLWLENSNFEEYLQSESMDCDNETNMMELRNQIEVPDAPPNTYLTTNDRPSTVIGQENSDSVVTLTNHSGVADPNTDIHITDNQSSVVGEHSHSGEYQPPAKDQVLSSGVFKVLTKERHSLTVEHQSPTADRQSPIVDRQLMTLEHTFSEERLQLMPMKTLQSQTENQPLIAENLPLPIVDLSLSTENNILTTKKEVTNVDVKLMTKRLVPTSINAVASQTVIQTEPSLPTSLEMEKMKNKTQIMLGSEIPIESKSNILNLKRSNIQIKTMDKISIGMKILNSPGEMRHPNSTCRLYNPLVVHSNPVATEDKTQKELKGSSTKEMMSNIPTELKIPCPVQSMNDYEVKIKKTTSPVAMITKHHPPQVDSLTLWQSSTVGQNSLITSDNLEDLNECPVGMYHPKIEKGFVGPEKVGGPSPSVQFADLHRTVCVGQIYSNNHSYLEQWQDVGQLRDANHPIHNYHLNYPMDYHTMNHPMRHQMNYQMNQHFNIRDSNNSKLRNKTIPTVDYENLVTRSSESPGDINYENTLANKYCRYNWQRSINEDYGSINTSIAYALRSIHLTIIGDPENSNDTSVMGTGRLAAALCRADGLVTVLPYRRHRIENGEILNGPIPGVCPLQLIGQAGLAGRRARLDVIER